MEMLMGTMWRSAEGSLWKLVVIACMHAHTQVHFPVNWNKKKLNLLLLVLSTRLIPSLFNKMKGYLKTDFLLNWPIYCRSINIHVKLRWCDISLSLTLSFSLPIPHSFFLQVIPQCHLYNKKHEIFMVLYFGCCNVWVHNLGPIAEMSYQQWLFS